MIPPVIIAWGLRIGLLLAVAGTLIGWGYMKGWDAAEGAWRKAELEQARRTVRVQTKQAQVTERIVTQFIEVKGQTQTRYKTIEKEVPVYVKVPTFIPSGQSDPELCPVPRGFVRVWNAASAGVPVSGSSTTGADDEASGLTLADVAHRHVGDAGQYAELAHQLTALQDWIRQQRALHQEPAP